jgi:hypothetical protein
MQFFLQAMHCCVRTFAKPHAFCLGRSRELSTIKRVILCETLQKIRAYRVSLAAYRTALRGSISFCVGAGQTSGSGAGIVCFLSESQPGSSREPMISLTRPAS